MTLQKKATVIASATSFLLIVIKTVIGIMSGSVAVLASAIDSVLDLIISVFNFFAVSKSEQPADEKFNYGRGKIEALAAVIEGTVITVSGLFILYESVKKGITGETTELLGPSMTVMLISLVITVALVTFLNYVAKKTKSMVVKSDALHYKTDVYTNAGILISLVLIYMTEFHVIDAIMGAAIAIYIIYSAYEIIKEGVFVLLDAALEEEVVDKIKEILTSEPGVNDYHWLKTRQSGKINFVDVHLVFTPDISLLKAHRLGDQVEAKIAALDKDADWTINIHLDPYDDTAVNEEQALRELKKN